VEDRRTKFRKGLSSLYLPYYDALCAELPPEWAPYYGFRSFNQQDNLFALGRTIAPIGKQHTVTNARGGESPHNYGCATDWILWEDGKPIWAKSDDPRWLVYVDAVKRVGLRPGAEFSIVDCPHNELKISCSWKHVLLAYNQNGMTSAQEHIERNLIK
jgi:hypothetical protein